MPSESSYDFELRVDQHGETAYALSLYQKNPKRNRNREADPSKVVQVWGDPLRAVIDQVLTALRKNRYKPTDLKRTRTSPFHLNEEEGVRLGLLFLAVKPLRKLSRIERIADRIRGMELEELYYWYSKSTASHDGQRAQKAFRILTAEE